MTTAEGGKTVVSAAGARFCVVTGINDASQAVGSTEFSCIGALTQGTSRRKRITTRPVSRRPRILPRRFGRPDFPRAVAYVHTFRPSIGSATCIGFGISEPRTEISAQTGDRKRFAVMENSGNLGAWGDRLTRPNRQNTVGTTPSKRQRRLYLSRLIQ